MHLIDILALRPVPAAGLFLTLTRRCPLTCEHCSTQSLMTSEQHSEKLFLRFVETFTRENRPEVLLLTGGEPLLRPKLVYEITERAHAVGTKVSMISGMFFAKQGKIPPAIARALAGIDHFTASMDIYHEKQVPRKHVFGVLQEMVERGQDVSLQVVGLDEQDPYLKDVTADIENSFNRKVPALVSTVNHIGRAKEWLETLETHLPAEIAPSPCSMAAWPVVIADGTVVACCNQTVIDGPPPAHLRLGHARQDEWGTIRQRSENSPLLRAVRLWGPQYVSERYGESQATCSGYCETCHKLGDVPQINEKLEPVMARPAMRFVQEQVIRLQQQTPAFGRPEYAHLARLGYAPDAERNAELCEV